MFVSLVLLVGCTPGLKDPSFPTGSSTVVTKGRSVYTVNAWDGTLARTDWEEGYESELVLGGEPTRIAKVGKDELWVTLRAERRVVVLRTTSSLPEEQASIQVGAEPYGIVATEDGSRVYVAVSQEDRVLEIDGNTREKLREFAVGDDPRWLALHPSERALFVGYAYNGGVVTRIDLESGQQKEIEPPVTEVPQDDGGSTELTPRGTGDLAINSVGDTLVVPTLYVDNNTPGEQPVVNGSDINPPPNPYYSGSSSGIGLQLSISRFNAALVGIPLDPRSGEVVDEPGDPGAPDGALAFFVGGFEAGGPVRGYITSATFDPAGTKVYATLESADAVAVVDLRPVEGQGMGPSVAAGALGGSGGPAVAPNEGGFWERGQVYVSVDGDPAGLAWDEEGNPWVHERGGRKVSWIQPSRVEDLLREVVEGQGFVQRVVANGRFGSGTVRLDPDAEAGRALFFSASDPRVSAPGSGVSCSTCHFEGRNDGLTWVFDNNPRNTPSLAGPVNLTAPVTWTETVASVADEAMITSIGRMGGQGILDHEALQIDAFIQQGRDVDTPLKGALDELVTRGAEVFADPAVGCAECHNGSRYTDNRLHDMFGLRVNTPGLVGVAATAPYLHDGSAATLRDLLLRVRDGSMGDTSSLSDEDLLALETYLRSL